MRKILWKSIVLISVILIWGSSAFTQGLKGWMDITNGNIENREDGSIISESDTFNRIFYLSLTEPVTPMFSYQFNIRSNWLDTSNTDSFGDVDTSYNRTVEPSIDLFLQNPIYDVGAGFRRREEWSTAHLANDGRETTDFYYSRLGILPEAFPSLTLQFDRQRKSDHLVVSETDSTNTIYTVNSSYSLPSSDLRMRYTINYSHTTNETPLNVTSKSEQDNFNGTFNAGYSGLFWNRKAGYSLGYQGHYTRNKNEQFFTQTGLLLLERIPLGGFYDQGTIDDVNDATVILTDQANLVDDDIITSTGINLRTGQFHNLDILVSSSKTVDRLYVYVNQNISTDATLLNKDNWTVAKSSFNLTGTWSSVGILSVTDSTVDAANSIYRYEIKFATPQNASFFKVYNEQFSDVIGTEVTEIEAYGEDSVEGTSVDVINTFNQQLNFSVDVRPVDKWSFLFNYSIDRSDENGESPYSSIGGIIENIYDDSITSDRAGFTSNVTRNYSLTSTWLTHSMLTSIFRVQRSESFDNEEVTDVSSNTYNLSFNSEPLPTVDANLSLIRNDSYTFNDKSSTNDSVVLSVGSKLYRDVNMITDIGFTRSESYLNGTTSSTRRINGTIDALLTKTVSTTFNYDFSWNESDSTTSRSSNNTATVTYRPGRFINITANLGAAESSGDMTTTEGILVDWLPLPAIRMNVNYQHSDSDPGSVKSDTLNSIVTWYITKFADLRTTYGYTKTVDTVKTESVNIRTSLNCRF